MKTQKHFQLIDGTFTPDQARQVLGAMVRSKINFHTLENRSESERSGIPNHTEERLQSLREIEAELKTLFDTAQASGAKLTVKGGFEIHLIE